MIAADDADAAIATAINLTEAVENEPLFPILRIGMHAGTAVSKDGDYLGSTVNLAARVAAHARGGQILCTSAVVRASAKDVSVRAPEVVQFKNVARPVEVFEIERQGAEQPTVIDPICRMRIDPSSAPVSMRIGADTHAFCSVDCARKMLNRLPE